MASEPPAGEPRWFAGLRAGCDRALTAAGVCYLVMTALVCFDIAARRWLGVSSAATAELSGYLLAAGMSFGLAATLLERGHVRIDVFVQKLPLRVRVALHLFALALVLATAALFVRGAARVVLDSWAFGATDLSNLKTPLVVPQGLWTAGLALFLVAALALACRSLALLAAGRAGSVDALLTARTDADEAGDTLRALGRPAPSAGDPAATEAGRGR